MKYSVLLIHKIFVLYGLVLDLPVYFLSVKGHSSLGIGIVFDSVKTIVNCQQSIKTNKLNGIEVEGY